MDTHSPNTNRFAPPKLKNVLVRSRLLNNLLERKDRKVIVVHGRAGQGKSSLVAHFLKSGNLDSFWFNLSKDDHDNLLLLARMQEGLKPLKGQQPSTFQDDPLSKSLRHFLLVLEKNFTKDVYLVLDNFQHVNRFAAVRELMNRLITFLPETIHLVLVSREYPQLSLSVSIAERQLVEIDDMDLAFTKEEIREFFTTLYALNLDALELEEIFDISGGWITALVHLAESLEIKPEELQKQILHTFISAKQLPSLKSFFEEEVFNGLSPERRETLIRLSVFSTITPDLVSHISPLPGANLFDGFSDTNLFMDRIDVDQKVYTFQPIFAQFLREKFNALPEAEQVQIHRSAADFYYHNNQRNEAAHHLLLSRGITEAQEIFLKEADELLVDGQYRKLHDLLESFPEQARNENPLLLYYYTITTNLVRPFLSRKTLLELLEIFRKSGDVNREARIHSVLLQNYIFYQGNREAVQELVQTAQAFMDVGGSQLNLENRLTLEALLDFGRWWTKPDLDEAYEIALRAEETSHKIHNEEVLIFSKIALARIYTDRGEFNKATEILEEAERIIVKYPSFRQYEPLLRFTLGDAYFYSGELNQALEQVDRGLERTYPEFAFCRYLKLNQVLYLLYIPELEKAENILDSIREEDIGENLYLHYLSLYLLHMLLAYRRNNRERAEFYCKRLMDPENQKLLDSDFPYSYLALSEVLVSFEHYEDAANVLEKLLTEAPQEKYPYPNATAFALLGLIKNQLGKKAESRQLFDKMGKILIAKEYRNLDICNPVIINNIAVTSKLPVFKEFPRLKHMSATQIINEPISGLYLYTLGEFRIVLNGEEIDSMVLSRHKKVMDLLKLLVVRRESGFVKEVLYNIFWPGYLEKSSRNNLNTITYRLRKILGEDAEYILTDASSIRLNLNICKIDVDDFITITNSGRAEEKKGNAQRALNAYLKAKDIYRGDFLESDLYYDDIRDERENLKNSYLQLLMKLIKIHLNSGKYHQALDLIREILVKDPLCEPAYRLLMVVSTLLGNRSEIPKIFERLNKKLLRSYNIEADPKTAALKNELLSGSVPASTMWQNETLI
jgi:LuxR family maltose regulon positive regulatory protein